MYTAIIVEPRKHTALFFVLNNILTNLSDEWNIVICHGNQNIDFVMDIVQHKLSHFINRITCINLNVDNLTRDQYSNLLIQPSFYEMIPTETFLIFQTDSIILSKNKDIINEFLEYDYVGAPWDHCPVASEQIGNGGFSLRRKSVMLDIIATVPYDTFAEDVYFCYHPTKKMHKPSFEKAKSFSVETLFHSAPFGCHRPWQMSGFDQRTFYTLYPEAYELCKLNHSN
jgi:hypothetical protein